MSIRVVIADDRPALRAGVRAVLEEDPQIEVVGEAENGQEAVSLINALTPDVAILDVAMPVMTGMEERAKVFVGSSPVFTTEEGFEGHVLAKYPENGSPLLSGYFLGEQYVQGYAAAVDVKHGEGRVVLLGMRPQWRGQPFGTFKVLFNAALYSNEVAAQAPSNDDFWTAPEEPETDDEEVGEGRGR